jgi:hypothetical protein
VGVEFDAALNDAAELILVRALSAPAHEMQPEDAGQDFAKLDFVEPDFAKPHFAGSGFTKPGFVKPDFAKSGFNVREL